MHDWRRYSSNTPTKFYQYKNRLEIVNPGGLYGNARPENFPDVNDYRNPVIAEALRVMGYVNKFNRGIARVQKELVENGNGKAAFTVDKVTVFSVNVTNAKAENVSAETDCGKDAPGNLAHYLCDHTTMYAWPMAGTGENLRFDIGSIDTYYEACEKYGVKNPLP